MLTRLLELPVMIGGGCGSLAMDRWMVGEKRRRRSYSDEVSASTKPNRAVSIYIHGRYKILVDENDDGHHSNPTAASDG